MASKSYQTVEAGSVREDEGVAFFGKNRVAMPARSAAIVNAGGVQKAAIANAALESPAIGKPTDDETSTGARKAVYTNDIGGAQNASPA